MQGSRFIQKVKTPLGWQHLSCAENQSDSSDGGLPTSQFSENQIQLHNFEYYSAKHHQDCSSDIKTR